MSEIGDTRREFRPGLVPTLLTLALLPVLVGLGIWQLDRYEQKTELERAYATADAAPIPADSVTGGERDRFRPVTARGRYDAGRQFLIDNMVRRGRNGFFVITPLRLDNGQLVLVNRGWIAQDSRREPTGDLDVSGEWRRIEGQVRGLQRMIDEDRYCIDVLTQISSATKALQGVATTLLDEHVRHCVRDAIDEGSDNADEKIEEALEVIHRLIKR